MRLFTRSEADADAASSVGQLVLHQIVCAVLANVYVVVRPSVVCLSVCRLSVTFVHPTQAIEIFSNILRRLVRWTSNDYDVKFYGDRPRGTPPLGC